MVEQLAVNQWVVGSSPTPGAKISNKQNGVMNFLITYHLIGREVNKNAEN